VIDRRSKGAFDGFCARLFDRNRVLVGELLLEGGLARQGILDRSAVEAALRNPAPSGELVMRLLALVDAEAWLRSWSDMPATGP
jgi:asparagine synthase (glutamine-hydrolysing)